MKIIAAALCLLAGSASAADLAAVRSAGVLRVGTTGDYKPFSFRAPDSSYRGADIAMARSLAAALGVRIVFVPTVWAKLSEDFAADRFDIAVGGVTILPAREKIAAFSTATVVDGKRPIARCADRTRFASIGAIDQPGVRVVVNPGASNEDFARAHFPHAALTVFPDNVTVFDEIAAGRQDVMVTDGNRGRSPSAVAPGALRCRCPGAVHPAGEGIYAAARPGLRRGRGRMVGGTRCAPGPGSARWTRPSTNPDMPPGAVAKPAGAPLLWGHENPLLASSPHCRRRTAWRHCRAGRGGQPSQHGPADRARLCRHQARRRAGAGHRQPWRLPGCSPN
ncbi:MAG: transporter substrate-binding domain-containing protein [Acetobacteraceae bacterium]